MQIQIVSVEDLPAAPVKVVPHTPIAMDDGVELSAKLWLPAGGAGAEHVAIVEVTPYRKADATAELDDLVYPYYAGHGHACVRVDVRGSGDSEVCAIKLFGSCWATFHLRQR